MPNEQSAAGSPPTQDAALHDSGTSVQAPDPAIEAPPAETQEPTGYQEEWYDEPVEQELPRRPRRRLLTPIPLTLLGVLLIACGFIGGALVEKGESSASGSSGSASGLASRFAALRSGAAAGTSAGGRGTTGTTGAGGFAGGTGAGGGAGLTAGQVAYISGSTLYVTNSEGGTVKVTTSPASTVTKTVKADVKGIHPGETVIVTGTPGAHGAVSAESIRISEAGAGGGLGALFGGGGGGSRSASGRRGGGGEPALFGG